MVKTIELFKVRPGETFALDDVEFVKLGDEMYGTLVLTRDAVMGGITFEDVNAERVDHNNYRGSNLEKQCLRWLENEHPDIRTYAIPCPIDLTTMDGRTDYGAPTVLVRALTIDEYRKYRRFIPDIRRWFWLATGWTTVGYRYSVFHCNPGCELHYIDVYNEASALRPALYLKSSTLVAVDDGEDSNGLSDYTELELLGELRRRIEGA